MPPKRRKPRDGAEDGGRCRTGSGTYRRTEFEADGQHCAAAAHAGALRVLVIDDDPVVLRATERAVAPLGIAVCGVTTAAPMFAGGVPQEYDAVLLDLNLGPNEHGLDVCVALRAGGYGRALLVVSGETDPAIKCELLRAGADDFVEKPFVAEELAARIRAVVRRCGSARSAGARETSGLSVDERGTVLVDGVAVSFSEGEEALLRALLAPGAGTQSVDALRRATGVASLRALEALISRTRKKLGKHWRAIETVRGRGYRYRRT